jgi:hypothetical protein
VARSWLSIRVDVVEGHGEHLWPRPGRIFAAARTHTFEQLADVIDDAFARWDRSHLQEFTLDDRTRLCIPDPDWEIEGEKTEDFRRAKLSRLHPGEQFVYVFDLGDDWAHLCTVGPERIDPVETLRILPDPPCRTGGGATSPTSTAADGTVTTASHRDRRIPASPTCLRCEPVGAPRTPGGGREHDPVAAESPTCLRPRTIGGDRGEDLEPLGPVVLRGGHDRPRWQA